MSKTIAFDLVYHRVCGPSPSLVEIFIVFFIPDPSPCVEYEYVFHIINIRALDICG